MKGVFKMTKFCTIEPSGKAYIYTKQDNADCYKKHVLGGRAEKITSDEFRAAYRAARQRIKIYFEVTTND